MKNFNTVYMPESKLVDCMQKGDTNLDEYLQKNGLDISEFKFVPMLKKKHVAVIGAGMSAEREISLMSSSGVVNSLIELGYQVTFIDMGADIAQAIAMIKPDIVYNSLHGTYGEDGCLPGLLNIMRIPYTGCGVMASSIAFNKKESAKIFRANGIKLADSVEVKKIDNIKTDPIPRPYVIKPLTQGSSIGVEVVFEGDDFSFAEYDFPYGNILVEEYLKGRELQVAVLNGKAMGVLEIKLLKGKIFYDYEVKYTEGFAEHICPALIPKSIYNKALNIAEQACKNFECDTGIIRVEFIYNEDEQELYMLEINTHPGMTPMSICPEIVGLQGINYTSLVDLVLKNAKFEG